MPSRSERSANWRQKVEASHDDDIQTRRSSGSRSGVSSTYYTSQSTSIQLEKQPKKSRKLMQGEILNVDTEKHFGFLAPIINSTELNSDVEGTTRNVYFKFGELESKNCTGGMLITPGDVMEYQLVSDADKERPRAAFARLYRCKARTMEALLEYVKSLVATSEEQPDVVLRNVTSCPTGFQLVLDYSSPSPELVKLTLHLCLILRRNRHAEMYRSRLKQMYSLFVGTRFLQSQNGVPNCILVYSGEENNRSLLKDFLMQLLEYVPSQLPHVVPILKQLAECEENPILHGRIDELNHSELEDCLFSNKLNEQEERLSCEAVRFLLNVLNILARGSNHVPGLQTWARLPLLPTIKELGASSSEECPILPVVMQKGRYCSPEHYYDTYFRLLRENCFAGLRQAIQALRLGKLNHQDIKLWINIRPVGVHFHTTSPGVTFAVQLPKAADKNYSKALPLSGSLVAFSDDGGRFVSPIWGIVSRCEESDCKECICFVEVVNQSGLPTSGSDDGSILSCARLTNGEDMVMVESPTYYRAYQPVLDALQHMDPQATPFIDELVYSRWPREAPDYLKNPSATLDWSCILQRNEMLSMLFREEEIRAEVGGLKSLINMGYQTTFDESQLKAVELALSNRLTVIQGPPGTGKTYIGVKLLQLLLSASTFPQESPVLVMTFKNLALDQFLEKCLSFCAEEGSIVRVGGRSRNLNLQKYNLQMKMERDDKYRIDRAENIEKLEEIQPELEKVLQDIYRCQLSFDPLMIIMQAPELQLLHFLDRLENTTRKEWIRQLSQGFTLAEILKGEYPGNAELASVAWQVKLLKQSLLTVIKRWMPKPQAIKTVQECYSVKKSCKRDLQGATSSADSLRNNNSTSATADAGELEQDDRREEEERRNDYESVRQEIKLEDVDGKCSPSEAGKTQYRWMENSFMPFPKEKDVHRTSLAYRHIDLDASQFDWLTLEDPYALSEVERAILVVIYWQRSLEVECHRYASLKAEYDTIVQDIEEIAKRRKVAILSKAKIIGMTTTGAAIHQSVLKCLSPALILIEEAAEILEPQVLAVLNSNLKHLILIGDHHQLRPPVESYNLERWHGFGVSMFERLVNNELPYQALSQQCRMREEFVPMLQPIYPFLSSHKELVSGTNNTAPNCMVHTMHFWSHQFDETGQRSYLNQGEAQMVVALARWIASELDNPKDLIILAAYNGQVTLIRKLLEKYSEMDGIDVHTIDRFQGAESRVVIVSLVRSNPNGKIGHLSVRGRLCVAASRARCGVYMCGNHKTLTQNSHDWRALLSYFEAQNALKSSISLCCPRHKSRPPYLLDGTTASEFDPQAVCSYPCGQVLPCGHVCSNTCHYKSHPKCKETVSFTFPVCGHLRDKKCYEDGQSLRCETKVIHGFEKCEHRAEYNCWEVRGQRKVDLKCQIVCGKELPCGHACRLLCSENCAGSPCGSCLEIEKEKEKILNQLRINAIATKQKELNEEIQKLKEQGDQGIVVKEVRSSDDTAQAFYKAKERTEMYLQPGYRRVPLVTKVERVVNLQLQRKFLEAQRELISPLEDTEWLFYSVSEQQLEQFVKNGFSAVRKKAYLFNVYSSTIAEGEHDEHKILLCEVHLGKTQRMHSILDYSSMNLVDLRKKGYDSLSLTANQESEGESRPIGHVIFSPEQAFPRFIVHYKLLNVVEDQFDGFEQLFDQQALIINGMCRVSLTPSVNFQGLCAAEIHFRIAESQFHRESRNRKYKVIKVDCIHNKALQERYFKKREEFKRKKLEDERLVFHGTDLTVIDRIASDGFKIGGTEGVKIKVGALYGHGVYTAVNPDISVAYCCGSNMMLMSLAILGEFDLDYTYGGCKNVFVIKNVCQLLPRYVVHYSTT